MGRTQKKERMKDRKEKALHGQFLRETEGMQDQRRWQWLKAGELKQETDSLICAAQEQAFRTNAIKIAPITRACPPYADSAKRKLKMPPIWSVRVLS